MNYIERPYKKRNFMKQVSKEISGIFGVILVLAIFAIILIRPFGIGTDPDGTTKVLSDQGYTNISITGYRYFMAGEHDWYSTGFVATSPNGARVSGAVTGGFLKGSTVRFD